MVQSIPRYLLIFLLFFNALGAYYGSYMFISDPTGGAIQMPLDKLQGTPFNDYLIPGIILLLVNGIFPTIAGIGLILRQPMKPILGIYFFKKQLWAWSLALLSGMGLMIWIAVQIAMINHGAPMDILQIIYGVLGFLIAGLSLQPSVQRYYKIIKKKEPLTKDGK